MKQKKLPRFLTTVTPFSKFLALSMLIFFPIVGFFLGRMYQEIKITKENMPSNQKSYSIIGDKNTSYSFSLSGDWVQKEPVFGGDGNGRKNPIIDISLSRDFTDTYNPTDTCYSISTTYFNEKLSNEEDRLRKLNELQSVSKTSQGFTILTHKGNNRQRIFDILLPDSYISISTYEACPKPKIDTAIEELLRTITFTGITNQENATPQKMCTMEAKQCPDGSYVGRSGPNCEFTTCP